MDNTLPSRCYVITMILRVRRKFFEITTFPNTADFLNLPAYEAGPAVGLRPNWDYRPKPVSADAAAAIDRLRVIQESEGLVASDLLIAFIERRVHPLQGRPHLICRMSGHPDLSRMCTKEMPTAEVAWMVNKNSDLKVSEAEWRYEKRPYSRHNPPPAVSFFALFL